jgi:hypothetical protein
MCSINSLLLGEPLCPVPSKPKLSNDTIPPSLVGGRFDECAEGYWVKPVLGVELRPLTQAGMMPFRLAKAVFRGVFGHSWRKLHGMWGYQHMGGRYRHGNVFLIIREMRGSCAGNRMMMWMEMQC